METKRLINLRGIDCLPEVEEAYIKWLDETHIPMLLETGEIKEANLYKRTGDSDSFPKYLAIYGFENQQAFERYQASPELAAAVEDVRKRWGKNGNQLKGWRVQYEAVKNYKK